MSILSSIRTGLAGGLFAICTLGVPAVAIAATVDFEISGTFSGATINGTAIDDAFVLSGTLGNLSGVPGPGAVVTGELLPSSVSLSYGGTVLATTVFNGQGEYGLSGGPLTPNTPRIYEVTQASGGPLDLKAATPSDSIVVQFMLEGETVWLGFGGQGRNMGITVTQDAAGVVQFGEDDWLARTLLPGQTVRTLTYVPSPAPVVPLPAAGWLLLGGVGSMLALGRRRVKARPA